MHSRRAGRERRFGRSSQPSRTLEARAPVRNDRLLSKQRRIIDVIPDRDVSTVEAWLSARPDIRVVSFAEANMVRRSADRRPKRRGSPLLVQGTYSRGRVERNATVARQAKFSHRHRFL